VSFVAVRVTGLLEAGSTDRVLPVEVTPIEGDERRSAPVQPANANTTMTTLMTIATSRRTTYRRSHPTSRLR
jgi:hypothetical protein